MRKALKITVLGLVLLMLSPCVWVVAKDYRVYAAKEGFVLDRDGKGIPDVAVIATAQFDVRYPLEGSAHDVLYRFIVHTDASGKYRVPSAWSEALRFFPAVPGVVPRVSWILTAFKPGLVIVGDVPALIADSDGRQRFQPDSISFPPSVSGGPWGLNVVSIRMEQANMTARQAAFYYGDIVAAFGWVHDAQFAPQEVAMRKDGYDFFVPLVCNAPANQKMDWDPIGFAYDRARALTAIEHAEPTDWNAAYSHPSLAQKTAGTICSAMSGPGAYP